MNLFKSQSSYPTREAADKSAERYVQEMVELKQTVDALEAGNKIIRVVA